MTILIFAEIFAGALILRLLFLLTGTKTIVCLDALFEVLDEYLVGVQHNAHQNSSNPSL